MKMYSKKNGWGRSCNRKKKVKSWKKFGLFLSGVLLVGVFSVKPIKGLVNNLLSKSKSVTTESSSVKNEKSDEDKNLSDDKKATENSDVNKESNNKKDEIKKDETKKDNGKETPIESNLSSNTSENAIIDLTCKVEENKNKDIKTYFENSVFLGDSISEGLSFYDILKENNVLAVKGLNLVSAKSYVDQLVALKPKNVFMLFGLNDLQNGINGDEFAKNYLELINEIRGKLPECDIYIQNVLPITQAAVAQNPLLSKERIDSFNESVKNIKKPENVFFIQADESKKAELEKFHEQDGIHYKPDFYNLWLGYIKDSTQLK